MQIWNSSNLKGNILYHTAGFPGTSTLPGDDKPYTHFIIADDAYALRYWMIKLFGHHTLTEPEGIL